MECKKCKAILSDGETFCRKCATSIYVEDEVALVQSSNTKVANNHKILNKRESVKSKPLEIYSAPKNLDLSSVNNKELINRGQNDERVARRDLIKSLSIIFLSLIALALLVAIAVSFL